MESWQAAKHIILDSCENFARLVNYFSVISIENKDEIDTFELKLYCMIHIL